MDAEEETVPPPYVLEDVAPPAGSALSLRVSDFGFDLTYSHGLHLGRAPQLRPGLFIGRDIELRYLSQSLLPGSSTRKVVAIAAVGGLGKTQLAITYAERYHQKYSSVFWLDAKDESTLKQELVGLADIVLEQGQIAAATSVDEDSVIKQVKHWFSFPNNNRWLLILDNYDDPKLPGLKSATGYDIRSYFPSRNQGSILITTRSKKLSFAKCLELKTLEDVAQSLEILSLRSGQDLAQNPGANALAFRLAGFPLALATAGAYIGQSSGGCGTQEYLILYDQQWNELQENADQLLEYEDRTLFSTWNLSLEQVRKQHPAAADLMSFLAYLGNSGLNYELFRIARDRGYEYRASWLNGLTESKTVFNKAMATLQNYSLVEHSPQGYSLHTCVHDWTLQILNHKVEQDYYWDAMLCIAVNVKPQQDRAYSWQHNQRLLQHATQIGKIQLHQPAVENFYDEDQAYSLNWVGDLWVKKPNFDKARVLLTTARIAYENLFGTYDLRTVDVSADLADMYKAMGLRTEAEDLYKRGLADCEHISALKEGLVSRLRNNLALLYMEQDKLAEGELLLRKALADKEVAFGLDDPPTLNSAINLAYLLSKQGKLLEAEELSQRAAEGMKKTLGTDHPLSLIAMETRAELHVEQKQWEQAEMLYKIVLEGRNRFFGSCHTETSEAASSLGRTYLKQKKSDELVKLAQLYGDFEPRLFWPLGYLYMANGDDRKAIVAFRQIYRDHDGILSWPGAFCDGCQRNGDLFTAAMGLFVCRTCDDIILCYQCGEQHQAGLKVFDHCAGHSFLGIPPEMLTSTSELTGVPDREE